MDKYKKTLFREKFCRTWNRGGNFPKTLPREEMVIGFSLDTAVGEKSKKVFHGKCFVVQGIDMEIYQKLCPGRYVSRENCFFSKFKRILYIIVNKSIPNEEIRLFCN